jgi:tripartite-type tricarboxylate transporter receptor subunit TctC
MLVLESDFWEGTMSTMNFPRRHFLHLAASAAALPAVSRIAWAQVYPARPVRIIVPSAPGGLLDIVARMLAQKLTEHLRKQHFVENVPGGGGLIGIGRAARAAADGYTLLMIDLTGFVVFPNLHDRVPYDPFKDFEPIASPVTTTQVLVVHPSLPVHSVKELVALIKANPGRYSYASAEIGTPSHLSGRAFPRLVGSRSRACAVQRRRPGDHFDS